MGGRRKPLLPKELLPEKFLQGQEYRLFLSYQDADGHIVMEPINIDNIEQHKDKDFQIAAADPETGTAIHDERTLNYIDVHTIKRNESGNIIDWANVLPKEWYESTMVKLAEGDIYLSSPEKLAFFKIPGDRTYDAKDLEEIIMHSNLSLDFVEETSHILQAAKEIRLKEAHNVIAEILPHLQENMSEQQVWEVFLHDPSIEPYLKTSAETILKDLAKEIASSKDKSFDTLYGIAVKVSKIKDDYEDKMRRISLIRKYIEDRDRLQQARERLENK